MMNINLFLRKVFIRILLSLCILHSLSSCKTLKNSGKTHQENTKKTYSIDDLNLKKNEIQTLDLNKLSFSVNFNNQNFNSKGFLRLNDSAILISIQPLAGIEVMRIQIKEESIIILNRMKSEYYLLKPEDLEKWGLNISLSSVRALIKNEIFILGKETENLKKEMFVLNEFPDGFELIVEENESQYKQSFILNKQAKLEKTSITDKKNPYFFVCDYSNHIWIENIYFPSILKFSIFDSQKTNFMTINASDIKINKTISTELIIPEKYKKSETNEFNF